MGDGAQIVAVRLELFAAAGGWKCRLGSHGEGCLRGEEVARGGSEGEEEGQEGVH